MFDWRRRSIYHYLTCPLMICGPNLILDELWRDEHISEINTVKDKFGLTVLHEVIFSLSSNLIWESDHETFGLGHRYELVQRLLENGSDVHAQTDTGRTPLDEMLYPLQCLEQDYRCLGPFDMDECRRRQRSLIRWWLDTLAATGFNLHEYARKEESLHPEGLFHQILRHPSRSRTICLSVWTIFSYGKNENELDMTLGEVWWEDPTWEVFWCDGTDREDRACLKMPGSWD